MTKNITDTSTSRRKTFPIRCVKCGEKAVQSTVIAYKTEKNQDGKLYELEVPDLQVNRCENCGEVYFSGDADDQINAALRMKLGLLTPDQIRENLDELRLSQKDAAEKLGVAPETISRWLTGAMIQSRAMDNLLRSFFGCVEVREHLRGEKQDRSFGISVRRRIEVCSVTHATFNSLPGATVERQGYTEVVVKFRGQRDAETLKRSLSFQLVSSVAYTH